MKRLSVAILAAAMSVPACAQTSEPLSNLAPASSVNGTDLFYDVQTPGIGGVKATASQLSNFILNNNNGGGAILATPSTTATATNFNLIPLAANTTGSPTFLVESIRNYNNDGTFYNYTGYFGTQVNFTAAAAWAGGLVSELEIKSNTWNGVGARPFAEALRGVCILDAGITPTTTCQGVVGIGSSASQYGLLNGFEGTVTQGVNTPPIPSLFSVTTSPNAAAFIASSTLNGGDAAFEVNPYQTTTGFQVGFWCPPELHSGKEVTTACFEAGTAGATYGLDLVNGTFTGGQINGKGFNFSSIGVLLLQIATFPQATFIGLGGNRGSISIDNNTGGFNSQIALLDAGAEKWVMGKDGANNFFLLDDTSGANLFAAVKAGNLSVTPNNSAGSTLFNGATAETAVDIAGSASIQPPGGGGGLRIYSAGSLSNFATIAFDTTKGISSTWPVSPSANGTLALGAVSFGWSSLYLAPLAISGLSTCNGAANGAVSFISDTVASTTPTFHGIVANGGAVHTQSLVSCNGASWVYD